MDAIDEDVPDDLETSDRYVLLPHKRDLDLGKRLALRFAVSELPDSHERIEGFFRHQGAYTRFKGLLQAEGALERWYKYEADATEKALRARCAENGIRLLGGKPDPAA